MPDLRTKAGRQEKQRIVVECVRLREFGLTVQQIANVVEIAPATVSVALIDARRWDLLHLSNAELRERRHQRIRA